MKNTDKFLLVLVVAIVLLVGVTVTAILLRPAPTYRAEDTPEAAAFNYLLALQQQDYPRAYSYLSPTLKGYPPSAQHFTDQISSRSWTFDSLRENTSQTTEPARVIGNSARVPVRVTHYYSGGLFSSGQYSSGFEMRLQREAEGWKIAGSDQYWLSCWTQDKGCD